MPKFYWIIIVAFGLAFATSGQAEQQEERTGGTATNQRSASENDPFGIPVRIIEDRNAVEARQRRELEAEQREIKDLAAQQGVNTATQSIDDATRDMRNYAYYSTLLVALGTIALIITLWQINVSNGILRRDQRPWISAKVEIRDGLGYEVIDGKNLLRIRFNVTLTNTGRSAAKVFFGSEYLISRHRESIPLPNSRPKNGRSYSILPGEVVDIHVPWNIDAAKFTALNSDDCVIPTLIINIAYSLYDKTSLEWFNRRAYTVWAKTEHGPLPNITIGDIPGTGKICQSRLYIKAEQSDAS